MKLRFDQDAAHRPLLMQAARIALVKMKISAPSRAFVAGVIWSLVGVFLILRGFFPYWIGTARESFWGGMAILVAAVLLGAAKGWFVLRRSSARVLAYIDLHREPQGFWHIYPPGFFLLIPLMIGLGLALRAGFADSLPALIAGIYLAVGTALLGSTPPFFRYWRTGGGAFDSG
jgi:hypothetical protein